MTPRYVVEISVAEQLGGDPRARDTADVRFTWALVSTFTDPRDASMLYGALLAQGERARWRELRE